MFYVLNTGNVPNAWVTADPLIYGLSCGDRDFKNEIINSLEDSLVTFVNKIVNT